VLKGEFNEIANYDEENIRKTDKKEEDAVDKKVN